MIAKTYSAITLGLKPIQAEVEVDGTQGTPNILIIGLANKTVDEARERITSSLINSGIRIRSKRTIVNLAPADIKKTSSAIELAIAVGILKMYGDIKLETDNGLFLGELSLDGSLKPIHGALPLVQAAARLGFSSVYLPFANVPEVQLITSVTIIPISHLREIIESARNKKPLPPMRPNPTLPITETKASAFEGICGQEEAKRALCIMAAGRHNLLMVGPPGTGKSILARQLVHLLPSLNTDEMLELTSIYSICGLTPQGLITNRPFRSPHHSASLAGMLGGGHGLLPGEISLAHQGVLFMDELPEFGRHILEALRQPLEDGFIALSRAQHKIEYPAQFSLIATANPCPCGHWGSAQKECVCLPSKRQTYWQKISGPILDRIDLHCWVGPSSYEELTDRSSRTERPSLIEQVKQAHQIQQLRYQHLPYKNNHYLTSLDIDTFCPLTSDARQLVKQALHQLQLSNRSFFKIIKVARTIADLEAAATIDVSHIAEALTYRPQLPNPS